MKKTHLLLGILFFSAVWGLCEAALGGWLYRVEAPGSGVILAVVALGILTVARVHIPLAGSSAAIASMAMLYKFLNEPFFACHLLGIFTLGAAYDVVYSLARGRGKPLIGAGATYLGFASFAVLITYVFRYEWWAQEGVAKVLRYIFVAGTIAAVCNAIMVPAADWLARRPAGSPQPSVGLPSWVMRTASLATAGLWVFALVQLSR